MLHDLDNFTKLWITCDIWLRFWNIINLSTGKFGAASPCLWNLKGIAKQKRNCSDSVVDAVNLRSNRGVTVCNDRGKRYMYTLRDTQTNTHRVKTRAQTPVSCQAFPESHFSVRADCHHPCMCCSFGLCTHTDIRIESKSQEKTTQQHSMVLAVLHDKTREHHVL